jgi:[acyl-carrier-protein] S-malonyltransferase
LSVAWLFPGQGSQSVGMGRALTETSPRARAVFERADRALGFSISRLCFEGPEPELLLTKHAQPAILTSSYAALEALQEAQPNLPTPAFVLGHSLGEYSALVAAGALVFEDAVRIVHERGLAMQEAVPEGHGGMAAIMGGDAAAVRQLCEDAAQGDVLAEANFNAPGQVVIAGTRAAIERAADLAKTRSLKAILLKVSAPFHSSLMEKARDRVARALDQVTVADPRIPVVCNVVGEPVSSGARLAELLVSQVDHAVLWEQSVRCVAAAGVDRALEIGPGQVLSGLVKRIDKSIRVWSVGTPDACLKAAESF